MADRMFHSVAEAWYSASKNNMADVRELIPEFFYLPGMYSILKIRSRGEIQGVQNSLKMGIAKAPSTSVKKKKRSKMTANHAFFKDEK